MPSVFDKVADGPAEGERGRAGSGTPKRDREPPLMDRKWEEVQIKVFTQWLNSYLEEAKMAVEDITTEIDGVRLCTFVELVSEKRIRARWNKKPRNHMQERENLTIALEHIAGFVRLVGVGSQDFEEHNRKMILGFLWTVYKHFRLEKALKEAGQGKGTMEEGLLNWVQKTTEGYRDVDVKNYRHSFNDGMAYLALVDKYVESNKDIIDYDVYEKDNQEENLATAFKFANEHLNIPMLLDPEEVVMGDVDDRTMVLYTSLFFQAFVAKESAMSADEKRRRAEAEMKALEEQSNAAGLTLKELQEENEKLRARIIDQEGTLAERDTEVKDLRAKLSALTDDFEQVKEHELELEGTVGELEGQVEELGEFKKEADSRNKTELRGLGVMRENLMQHLDQLHQWEGLLMPGGTTADVLQSGEIKAEVLAQVASMGYDDQLEALAARLSKENEELGDKLKGVEAEANVQASKAKGGAKDAGKDASKDDDKDGKKEKSSKKSKSSKKR